MERKRRFIYLPIHSFIHSTKEETFHLFTNSFINHQEPGIVLYLGTKLIKKDVEKLPSAGIHDVKQKVTKYDPLDD